MKMSDSISSALSSILHTIKYISYFDWISQIASWIDDITAMIISAL